MKMCLSWLQVHRLCWMKPTSVAMLTVQPTLLIVLGAYCAPLTCSHCDFSAMIDSLAKWIELQGVKEKSWGCQNLKVLSILPFHTQLAPIRSLHVTLPALVKPCSRKGRCSTSVAPATHAATGQCLMSSTEPGPTQSTSMRGKYQCKRFTPESSPRVFECII